MRDWPNTDCGKCGALPKEPCVTKKGNVASCTHSARPFRDAEEEAEYQAHRARYREPELDATARWHRDHFEAISRATAAERARAPQGPPIGFRLW